MDGVSIVTLVRNRKSALKNFIEGLTAGEEMPNELVVVFMNEEISELPSTSFNIVPIELKDRETIPLAKARNVGAKAAKFDKFIFLDVDCIPAKTLVKDYYNCIDGKHLWSGSIRYLSKGATKEDKFINRLDELSKPDSIRSGIEDLPYELFWSLNFGCSKKIFNKIGGFDERYQGYGAEDTDFAFRAREQKVKLKTTPIIAYHQYHKSYHPPVNHLGDIVKNANRFYSLWKKWPMEGWLKKFEEMGLINWNEEVSIIRLPAPDEINQTEK